jgi:hypothetical protein
LARYGAPTKSRRPIFSIQPEAIHFVSVGAMSSKQFLESGGMHDAPSSDPNRPRTVTSPITVCRLQYAQGGDCRLAPVILGQGVEHEFDPGGDP